MAINVIVLLTHFVTYLGIVFLVVLVVGLLVPGMGDAVIRHYARHRPRNREQFLELKREYELSEKRKKQKAAKLKRRWERQGISKKQLALFPVVVLRWAVTMAPFEWGERMIVRFNKRMEDFLEPFDRFLGIR